MKTKVINLVLDCSYSKEDQFMFFPTVDRISAKLFPKSLDEEIKLQLHANNLKGKIKLPAAHNFKISIMNSIFSFECDQVTGLAKEKALMAMTDFIFRLFLIKRLRRYCLHLRDPTENEKAFNDAYLGSDIIKTVYLKASKKDQDNGTGNQLSFEY
jgi:hypothetical protein